MAIFQLIVRGQSGKHTRGDCVAIDLTADTRVAAIAEARILLIGDPAKWEAKWHRSVYGDKLDLEVWLDPDGEAYYGVLLHPRADEQVCAAWIVQTDVAFSIDDLKGEIETWIEAQRKTMQQDPEYVEYMRLKSKFG